MRAAAPLLIAFALGGCAATTGLADPPQPPWRDAAFAAPREEPASAPDVFALSPAMERYLHDEIVPKARAKGRQQALVDALLRPGQLRLEYDTSRTRTAAEAFEARSGNCLSLVIMASAFAKALGLQVEYQSAFLEETWSRQADLLVRSGHVNLTIGPRALDLHSPGDTRRVTIDFLPPEAARALRTRTLGERTVVAMFLNNRAAEALVAGRLDDAYAWARAAIRHSPGFLGAHNTLALLYLRRGEAAAAQTVLRGVLARDPDNTRALSNLALALLQEGRVDEAVAVQAQLARLEPQPPLHALALGLAALERRDWAAARDWFARELARDDDQPQVHHWLALAYWQLGDEARAREQLARAMAQSGSARERQLYAAKLAWLRNQGHP